MTDKIEKFKELLKIDRDNLEGELLTHAQNLFEISDEALAAVGQRDKLKQEMEELHATLDKKLRAKYAESGEKVTEGKISNEITGSKDMKALNASFLKAKELADRWRALERAYGARGDMLQYLTSIELRALGAMNAASTHERGVSHLKSKRGEEAVARQRKKYEEE